MSRAEEIRTRTDTLLKPLVDLITATENLELDDYPEFMDLSSQIYDAEQAGYYLRLSLKELTPLLLKLDPTLQDRRTTKNPQITGNYIDLALQEGVLVTVITLPKGVKVGSIDHVLKQTPVVRAKRHTRGAVPPAGRYASHWEEYFPAKPFGLT